MSEASERLRSLLAELHSQLEQLEDHADPEVRQMLEGALDEVRHALGDQPPPETPAEKGSLARRLAAAARHFEETHPTLSATLGSTIDALSRMGI